MDFDYKIIFWVLAIGFYIYTQLKEAFKKGNKTDPIPMGPSIPSRREEPKRTVNEPVTTSSSDPYKRPSYKAQTPKFAKRFQSTYSKSQDIKERNSPDADNYSKEVVSREAFYKETHKQVTPVNYEDAQGTDTSVKSDFGVDEHLEHYAIKPKPKHPLITFLSDKNNLRNAFITGEVLKKRD